MLQSITRNKAESFLLGDSVKAPREDIMTDVVFGGLRYFDCQQAGVALHWLMPDVVRAGTMVQKVSLWPVRDRVEPDVVIDLATPTGAGVRVIVEAKWMRNILTAGQLGAQWRKFGPGTPGASTEVIHLLLVQHRIAVEPAALELAPQDLRPCRHLMTWGDLAANARKRMSSLGTPELNLWIQDVIAVINLGDGQAFTGWRSVPEVASPSEGPVFYKSKYWDSPTLCRTVEPHQSFFG